MGFFSKFFGGDPEKVYKTCVDIYEKAKRKRPGKPERDYLKLVLLTKPPYDYQRDEVIDLLLDESGSRRYTCKQNGPWRLRHHEEYATRSEAMKRERFLKSGQGREWIQKNITDK